MTKAMGLRDTTTEKYKMKRRIKSLSNNGSINQLPGFDVNSVESQK
jgi:hypothetical protein